MATNILYTCHYIFLGKRSQAFDRCIRQHLLALGIFLHQKQKQRSSCNGKKKGISFFSNCIVIYD